jgi:hypothetical protein
MEPGGRFAVARTLLLGIALATSAHASWSQDGIESPPRVSRGVEVLAGADSGGGWYAGSYALLIGVSDYTAGWTDLETVPEELEEVAVELEAHGFEVQKLVDPVADDLTRAIGDFLVTYGFGESSRNNRLLIFYSGHGYSRTVGNQVKGYLVPADAPLPHTAGRENKSFLRKALRMSQVLEWARELEARHALFLFDSCFSGTIFKTRSPLDTPGSIGALTVQPVRQFITAGSASEEVPAQSVFARAFVRGIRGAADLTGDGFVLGTELGIYLRDELVHYRTGQTSQFGKIRDPDLDRGDFVFRLGSHGADRPSANLVPQMPSTTPGRQAPGVAGQVSKPSGRIPWPKGGPQRPERRNPVDGLYYAWVPADTGGFWLSRTEVTVRAYLRYLPRPSLPQAPPSNPQWQDESQPMVNLTRAEAVRFCEWAATRLPTGAEWEYAARAADLADRAANLEEVAWVASNSNSKAHSVSQKEPNSFGLYDMLGNVSEWVLEDAGAESGRGWLRGGSWLDEPRDVTYSFRRQASPEGRNPMYGFRCLALSDG